MQEEKQRLFLVIADPDYDFLRRTEEKIIREFAQETEIQLITDQAYLKQFFEEHRTIDVLMIDESLYGEYLKEHSIRKILLMVQEISVGRLWPDNVEVLMKYLPSDELASRIGKALKASEELPLPEEKDEHDPTLVAVYSPIGGCGKSLACIALARKLQKLDQKVLLISWDPNQNLAAYFVSNVHAGEELAQKLREPDDDTYWTILQNIGREDVSYLLPFEKSLPCLGLGTEELRTLLTTLRQKKDFDYLILDAGTAISRDLTGIMEENDCLILLTESSEIAGKKMQKLLRNAELLPRCKCMVIANEHGRGAQRASRENVFGVIAPYDTWQEALEDPVFYRIALQIT